MPGEVEQADRGVAKGGHDLWSVAGAELVTVFVEHDVADLLRGSSLGTGLCSGCLRCSEADGEEFSLRDRCCAGTRFGVSPVSCRGVELGDEFAVGGARGGEILVPFIQL